MAEEDERAVAEAVDELRQLVPALRAHGCEEGVCIACAALSAHRLLDETGDLGHCAPLVAEGLRCALTYAKGLLPRH